MWLIEYIVILICREDSIGFVSKHKESAVRLKVQRYFYTPKSNRLINGLMVEYFGMRLPNSQGLRESS